MNQFDWWGRVQRRFSPDNPLDGAGFLYNLEGDISRLLLLTIEHACRPRGGRAAVRALGFMMGRRYLPGVGALIANAPAKLRSAVEQESAMFQRRFLRELDAVFRQRVIDRDTVLRLVQEFFEHWERLAEFAELITAHPQCAIKIRREIACVREAIESRCDVDDRRSPGR